MTQNTYTCSIKIYKCLTQLNLILSCQRRIIHSKTKTHVLFYRLPDSSSVGYLQTLRLGVNKTTFSVCVLLKTHPEAHVCSFYGDGGFAGRCVSLRCGLCTKHTHTKLLLLQMICVWGLFGFFFSPQENWTKEDHDWRFLACLELKRHPFSTFTEIPKAAVTKMTPRQ